MKKVWTAPIILSAIIMGAAIIAGCSPKVSGKAEAKGKPKEEAVHTASTEEYTEEYTGDESSSFEKGMINRDEFIKRMEEMGKEAAEIERTPGINKPAIRVNGEIITRKNVKILLSGNKYVETKTDKEAIDELIVNTAMIAEARRLKIKPSQKEIDKAMAPVKQMLSQDEEASGIGVYIKARGTTKEKYLRESEQTYKEMYTRAALWEKVGKAQGFKDYDEYRQHIKDNADIKIIDPEVKEILK